MKHIAHLKFQVAFNCLETYQQKGKLHVYVNTKDF